LVGIHYISNAVALPGLIVHCLALFKKLSFEISFIKTALMLYKKSPRMFGKWFCSFGGIFCWWIRKSWFSKQGYKAHWTYPKFDVTK